MRQLDADRLGDGQRVIEADRRGAHVEPGVDDQQRAAVQARPGDRPVARLRGGRQCHEQQHATREELIGGLHHGAGWPGPARPGPGPGPGASPAACGRVVRVHAVLTGPTDTDMNRGLDIPKASPESVARAIFDGVENGEEDIFPDPMSQSMAESWRSGAAKALERQLSALVEAEPVKS